MVQATAPPSCTTSSEQFATKGSKNGRPSDVLGAKKRLSAGQVSGARGATVSVADFDVEPWLSHSSETRWLAAGLTLLTLGLTITTLVLTGFA